MSLIQTHFPIVRYVDGTKVLLNPVIRQVVADRPEERVRLRTIEFLCREAGFSLNRMNTEQGLHHGFGGPSNQRTDIVCFDATHHPVLLVECKAEGIKLNEKVAVQGARYNRNVQAPYTLLTNGISDVLLAMKEDGSVEVLNGWERVSELTIESRRDVDYWVQRGFISPRAEESGFSDTACDWLTRLYSGDDAQNQYIQVRVPDEILRVTGESMRPVLAQYMRVYPREASGARQAIGLVSGMGRVSGEDSPIAVLIRIFNDPAISAPKWTFTAFIFTKLRLNCDQLSQIQILHQLFCNWITRIQRINFGNHFRKLRLKLSPSVYWDLDVCPKQEESLCKNNDLSKWRYVFIVKPCVNTVDLRHLTF
jgi:hypothetical protein